MWLIAIKHIYTLAFGGGASTCKCMCGKWRFFILKIRQEKKEIKNTLHSVYMRGENLSGKKNREKVLFWHPCYENITPTGKYESKNKILSSLLLSKNWLFFCSCLIHSLAWFIDKNSFHPVPTNVKVDRREKHFFSSIASQVKNGDLV